MRPCVRTGIYAPEKGSNSPPLGVTACMNKKTECEQNHNNNKCDD